MPARTTAGDKEVARLVLQIRCQDGEVVAIEKRRAVAGLRTKSILIRWKGATEREHLTIVQADGSRIDRLSVNVSQFCSHSGPPL